MTSPLVPGFILAQDARGRTRGGFEGPTLFTEIAGFTPLAEFLRGQEAAGAATLAEAIRFYFDPLVTAVRRAGGIITAFAGETCTAVFPQTDDRDPAPLVLQVAGRLQRLQGEHPRYATRFGEFPFTVSTGLSWGEVRWEILPVATGTAIYYFQGAGIDRGVAAQRRAGPGEVLCDAAFLGHCPEAAVEPADPGLYRLTPARSVSLPPAPPAPGVGAGRSARFVPPAARGVPPDGEFRTVTVVFLSFGPVDNLTALATLLHLEAARAGGRLLRLDFGKEGCRTLFLFGAPEASAHDLERALDFTLSVRQRCHPQVVMRAGVTHGPGYVGFVGGRARHALTCLGRTAARAARLLEAAPRGEVWCGPEVSRLTRSAYTYASQGGQRLPGFPEPVPTQALVGKQLDVALETVAGSMVGRDRELEALAGAVAPIFSGQGAGLVYVEGEVGIGKSTLLDAFRYRLTTSRAPYLWITAPCDQILRRSLHPFVTALREYCRQSVTKTRDQNLRAFNVTWKALRARLPREAAALREPLQRYRSILGALVGLRWRDSLYDRLDPQLRFENTLFALRDWLQAVSRVRPLILYVEDAHWLDQDSLRVLEVFLRCAAALPLVVVLSCRPRDDGTPYRVPVPPGVPRQRIRLSALDPEALRALAESVLVAPVHDDLVLFLYERTEGNPLFAQQVLLYLRDHQGLRSTAGGLAPAVDQVPLPASVHAVLAARLDRLPAAVKRVVQAAAVLGQEFELAVLSRVLDGGPEVAARVRQAEDRQILLRVGEGEYMFRHALLRDTAYDLLGPDAQALHRRAAAALEDRFAEDRETHAGALVYHYERGDLPDRARACLEQAGDAARAGFRNAEALDYYLRLLRLLPARGESTRQACLRASEVLEVLARWEEAIAMCDRALQALETPAPEAWMRKATAWRLMGKMEAARPEAEAGLAWARRSGEAKWEGAFLGVLGQVSWQTGDLAVAQELLEQGLAVQRSIQNRAGEATGLSNLGVVLRQRGNLEAAWELQEASLKIRRELGDRIGEAASLNNLGGAAYVMGDLARAEALYRQSLRIKQGLGDRYGEGVTLNNLGHIASDRGDGPAAQEHYERSLRIREQIGDRLGTALALGSLGELHLSREDPAQALTFLDQAQAICDELGDKDPEFLLYRVEALRRLGRVGEAQAAWDQAQPRVREMGNPEHQARADLFRGHLCRDRGDLAGARAAYAAAAVAARANTLTPLAETAEAALRGLPGEPGPRP